MTILDSGYSALDYQPVGQFGRILALARMEFGKIFKSKKGLILFIACVVYVVVLLVSMYLNLGPQSETAAQIQSVISPRLIPFRKEFYIGFSTGEGFLAFLLLTTLVGVRSIAGDRAVNALEIYWTRGISPWGYFLGKWMGSFLLLTAVFVAGPLVVWLYGLISAPDSRFFDTTIRFMPMVVVALVLKCLVLSFLAVAFSGLSASPNVVTFSWLIAILGSAALVRVLEKVLRAPPGEVTRPVDWLDALCPWDAMVRIEESLVGLVRVSDYEVWIAWLCLGALAVVLLARLSRVLRTSEAVA